MLSIVLPYISYILTLFSSWEVDWMHLVVHNVSRCCLHFFKRQIKHKNIQTSISHAYEVYCLNSLNRLPFVYMHKIHRVLCFCFVCFRLVSCVPNVASFSGLSFTDYPLRFSLTLIENRISLKENGSKLRKFWKQFD